MQGFFKIEERKEFSFEDKLKWALKNVTNSCNPKETHKERIEYYDLKKNKKKSLTIPICEFTVPKMLPESVFDDLRFWIDDETCFIELPDAKYQFHLSQLLRVNKGLLKANK